MPAKRHDLASPSHSSYRKTIGHGFAKSTQIGLYAMHMLCTFHVPTKACDGFVKDEDNAMLFAQGLYLLQIIGLFTQKLRVQTACPQQPEDVPTAGHSVAAGSKITQAN
jgi:hypothetical protein